MRSSVGLTQAALKTLESSGAIGLNAVGAMAVIWSRWITKHSDSCGYQQCGVRDALALYPFYEGLASGLKAQFDGIPFYYAICAARIFAWSVYLTACMTWRCFPTGGGKLSHAKRVMPRAELGPHTYVGEHQLICRKGESQT